MKFFLLIILFLISLTATGSTGFKLDTVMVDCTNSDTCNQRKVRFGNLVGEYRSLVHLKETLRILANDGGYQSFRYELLKEEKKFTLNIFIKIKPLIKTINIGAIDRNINIDPSRLLTIKEGDYFEEYKLQENLETLKQRLEAMGYPHNSHSLTLSEENHLINITLAITLGKPRIFKKIKTNTTSPFIEKYLKDKFVVYYDQPFEFTKFKLYLDEAQKELFSYGYYLLSMDFSPIIKNDRVTLDIKTSNDQFFAFDFKNLQHESRETIHSLVTDLFKKYKRPLTQSVLKQAIKEHYEKQALLNTTVEIKISKNKNKLNETLIVYHITLDEKYKTRMNSVNFIGNLFYSQNKLQDFFSDKAFELASIKYYDSEYLDFFPGFLKEKYIKNGFVQARIQGPITGYDSEKKNAQVEYIINEGVRAFVREIKFIGLPEGLELPILNEFKNKENNPFDPVSLVEDLKKVSDILQEKGYYFAEVTNANEDSIVKYSKSGADVFIRFDINSGPIVKLNRVIFIGNNKTRKKVIQKKIPLEANEIVTPSKTRDIEASLSATGLFTSVSVQPLRHGSKNATTDLIVKVTERDYGLIEVAPGFRTDLGIKLTGTASYTNIGGQNLALTLRSQVNQRVNYQNFDPRRRKQKRQFLEHNTSLIFTKGDIFDTMIDATTGLSYQRKRFYSFDADITRVNTTLTRHLTDNLSSSIRYQLENISQSNATESRDNASFQIGAITPSLTYDLRNSLINPVKGAFFNLSTEFANPFFLSQKTDDLTINYYKLISRNRFYIPFKNGTVAISMVGGVQQNLAVSKETDSTGEQVTEGYIPNIKVFRLTGLDIVRGFNDEELNKIGDTREDISQIRIEDKAFLANFKLEPRYFINDTLIAGVFYDAGRVFVDRVDLGKLRDSVGVTFKILTPVGTLDFDYGIKLLRKKNLDGSLEDPGRFHVSIGFF